MYSVGCQVYIYDLQPWVHRLPIVCGGGGGLVSSWFHIGLWRSLEAHLLWEQGVVSSNLTSPTRWTSAMAKVHRSVRKAVPQSARPYTRAAVPPKTAACVSSEYEDRHDR